MIRIALKVMANASTPSTDFASTHLGPKTTSTTSGAVAHMPKNIGTAIVAIIRSALSA